MKRTAQIAASLALLISVPALSHAGEAAALASEVKEIFRANCSECHNGGAAAEGFRALDYEAMVADGHLDPGSPDDSYLFERITAVGPEAMPPEERPPLTAEQVAAVRTWIADGAEAFPKDVSSPGDPVLPDEKEWADEGSSDKKDNGKAEPAPVAPEPEDPALRDDRGVLAIILAHVRSQPADDRPFYRYFSTRHRLRAGATEAVLTQQRLALAKAINHLSRESEMVVPTPLDDVAGGTVFAVDIRRLGWHRRKLLPVDTSTATENRSLTLFDLVLLEYPYAVFRDDDPTTLAVADEFLRLANQVRPIPFLRVDWFCSVALQPPLYHDLMQLPLTLSELEEDLEVDAESNLQDVLAKRAGVTVSRVSRNNRIVERHPQANGYYWKSHDFASNTGSENILVNPVDFVPSGGEMIFRLPNGSQGYYVSDARGKRIDAAPTSIVTDRHASDRVVRNGLGCIRCHSAGMKTFHDDIRDVLDVLPGRPGFDKTFARRQYPGNGEWRRVLARDTARFQDAMAEIGVDTQGEGPITKVSREYLERTLNTAAAAAELGLADKRTTGGDLLVAAATQLQAVCASPSLTRLGLASFAAGGVVRRDAWEDNFDTAVRDLGIGVPIVPVNGLLRNEYLNDAIASEVVLRTSKKNGVFDVGDKLRVFVDNKSKNDVHIDLFGTGAFGKTVRLGRASTKIPAGETFQFPAKGEDPIDIVGGLGREQITIYVSDAPLPPSTILRGENIADRVVHRSYRLEPGDGASATPTVKADAADIVKKSLFIETN